MTSVNSTVAGTCLRGLYIAVRRSRRASGTFEMPIAVSPWVRGASRAEVMSWKRVDLPLGGKPMRAARSMSPSAYQSAGGQILAAIRIRGQILPAGQIWGQLPERGVSTLG